MEKRNKLILIGVIILTVIVLIICGYLILNNQNNVLDYEKFRNEYMELNDKDNGNGQIYPNVTISEDNNIKYLTENEAIKLLKEGTGVIYFGYSSCPWCRSLVSPLLDVAKENNEIIYYLDIKDIRSSFSVQEGKLVTDKEGSKGYYEIIKLLDKYLDEYYIGFDDELIDTTEKRLYAPTLVAIQNGKVTDIHVGTVESQKSGYDRLSSDEIDELKDIVNNLINSKNEKNCSQNNC